MNLKTGLTTVMGSTPPIIVPGILSDIEGIMKKIQKKICRDDENVVTL
jgi:hypothetical protein